MKKYSSKNNNLIIIDKNKKNVILGYFTCEDNILYYVLCKNITKTENSAVTIYDQEKIKLEGIWTINKNHDLVYNISKDKEKGSICLNGTIIHIGADEILFSLSSLVSNNSSKINVLKFSGAWKKNEKNKLVFEIEKTNNKNDILEFKLNWKITKDCELEYSYKKRELKKNTKYIKTLVLEGVWQITGKDRIRYLLGCENNKFIEFNAYLESNNIYPKRKTLKYRIGLGYLKNDRGKQLVLNGVWNIYDKIHIEFITTYKNNKNYSNKFLVGYKFTSKNKIEAILSTIEHEPLEFKLIYTKTFFKDSQAFIDFKHSIKENILEFGIEILF